MDWTDRRLYDDELDNQLRPITVYDLQVSKYALPR